MLFWEERCCEEPLVGITAGGSNFLSWGQLLCPCWLLGLVTCQKCGSEALVGHQLFQKIPRVLFFPPVSHVLLQLHGPVPGLRAQQRGCAQPQEGFIPSRALLWLLQLLSYNQHLTWGPLPPQPMAFPGTYSFFKSVQP